jgi:formylglycine-generating enzyme required for sulfatase activity
MPSKIPCSLAVGLLRQAARSGLPATIAGTLTGLVLLLPAAGGSLPAEPVMTVETWKNNDADFAAMDRQIQATAARNLLSRPRVKVFLDGREADDLWPLADGAAGQRGAEGRVFLGGKPSVVTFYLGAARPIQEVGVFSFNIDSRANQIYAVRFADNSRRPGVMPSFSGPPDCRTGDKVIGPNAGGCHSRFADPHGGPLAKADWVEFRFWPTLGLQAGEPAFAKRVTSPGAGVIVELEVLGAQNDLAAMSPEGIAFRQILRTTPRQAEFVRRASWQETLVASREALLEWEGLQDYLALRKGPVELGPWYVLGPLSPRSKDIRELRAARSIDLGRRYQGEDGRPIGWQQRDDLQDGRVHDLAGYQNGSRQAVYFLCRSVTLQRDLRRRELNLEVAAQRGWATWLPERRGGGLQNSLPLLSGGSDLSCEEGQHQYLLQLQPDKEGHCPFCFAVRSPRHRPGAGDPGHRVAARDRLLERVRTEFTGAADQLQIEWELAGEIWGAPQRRTPEDWTPGQADVYLKARYRSAITERVQRLSTLLAETTGVKAMAIAGVRDRIQVWRETAEKSLAPGLTARQLREKFYRLATIEEAVALAGRARSMRLAVEDQRQMFKQRYPQAEGFLRRIAALEARVGDLWRCVLSDDAAGASSLLGVKQELDTAQAEILLDTPLLAFGKLLVVKGHTGFASNWSGPNHLGQELVMLSPVRPDGRQTTLYKGSISDMDLHWDGRRLLFSDGRGLWEMHVDGSGLRRVSADDPQITHYDGCYLPDGRIVCISNACEQAVPCTGQGDVGNLHLMDADGRHERRVAFEQDHDWNPAVLNDGRVLYTRWEYTDLPHYFSRMLFRMNPDGTGQMEYYGSGSYWPNAMYWPRPIPGHPTAIVCIVSGHHGVSRSGELLLLDPARGRHEADGVIQRIPGYQQKVEPVIQDQLVTRVWPKFAAPYPLAEAGTNLGAGKYFLACVQRNSGSTWDLCLVDIFDNLTPILTGGYMTPIPLRPRPMPPVVPSNIDPGQPDGLIYLADIYQGNGLRGYPRGSIKALRIGTHHFRYPGNGDTKASSYEGGWDIKRILGTVPVREDGSALFHVPANTPIFVQPLDAEGKSQQQMRSWYTAMPGESASCIGCHERQNVGPPSKYTLAARGRASRIEPWNGPARGFSFEREVQPVLDRKCAGCHNGQPSPQGGGAVATIDLRAKRLRPEYQDNYSPAYMELQRYVRRAGYESDFHLAAPAEFEADTSVLVQLLKKGHYNVELSRDDWQRLYAWIDYNVPYPANWRESHRPPQDEQVERRARHQQQFAGIEDHDEDPLPLPPVARFEPPRPVAARPAARLTCAGWPLGAAQARALQKSAGAAQMSLDLGGGAAMKFCLIPAGRFVMGAAAGFADEQPQSIVAVGRPFYLGQLEVTNQQYAQFDPRHENGYIEGRGKDRTTRGYSIEAPDQPVVRISWNEALAFCEWLSQKTGRRCTLPTEAQWEWACRAGTDSAYSFGEYRPGMNNLCNIADTSIAAWNYGRCEPGYTDGASYSVAGGRYAANAWGLQDMHGNVAEWCLSAYRPYPYRGDDGRDDPRAPGPKVVRGGSWNDTLRYASSASRWRYQPYQPVYNVGFRVLVDLKPAATVAAASR